MPSIVLRAIAAVRSWLGFNDPAENHLHATHGWLLPVPAEARAFRLGRALSQVAPAMVPPSSGKRQ
jgi:hypothetical protein